MKQDNGTEQAKEAIAGLKSDDKDLVKTSVQILAGLVGSDSGVFSGGTSLSFTLRLGTLLGLHLQ